MVTSRVRRECATAGAEVAVVSSRNSRALLSERWNGIRLSLRACWRRATVQSLMEVAELVGGAGHLGLAALWPWVDRREDGRSEVRCLGDRLLPGRRRG